MSFPRKRESTNGWWTPAFAGVTCKRNFWDSLSTSATHDYRNRHVILRTTIGQSPGHSHGKCVTLHYNRPRRCLGLYPLAPLELACQDHVPPHAAGLRGPDLQLTCRRKIQRSTSPRTMSSEAIVATASAISVRGFSGDFTIASRAEMAQNDGERALMRRATSVPSETM